MDEDVYIDLGGVIVPHASLSIPRAREFAASIAEGSLDYVRLIECRTQSTDGGSQETVVFDVDVQRPQRRAYPIRQIERIAVEFTAADNTAPEVLALRESFPWAPHTNLRIRELPRSLCIYDESWPEIELRWTPANFIDRIRHWLCETSRGELHGADQPLEPLLLGSGDKLVLPGDLFEGENADPEELLVYRPSSADGARIYVGIRPSDTREEGVHWLALSLIAKPLTHGIIRQTPTNLAELSVLLAEGGIDLIDVFKQHALAWKDSGWLDKHLLLIVAFPKTRETGAIVESTDIWCFLSASTIREIGIAIGYWEDQRGQLGCVIGGVPGADGKDVAMCIVTPVLDFSRKLAASLSGEEPDERKVVAVGLGALGSQVVSTLGRSGFGSWTMVDEDDFLPHNLGRHALDGRAVGFNKAFVMAFQVGRLYQSDQPTAWIPADVLRPGEHADRLASALNDAELILDMAASIPVSRHLALDVPSNGRRIAIFLNPIGSDLVVLAEDAERELTLDVLEMQYFQAIAANDTLEKHLQRAETGLRYSRTCRDVSAVLPNHLLALHAAIAARAVRAAVSSPAAAIRVWQAERESLSVAHEAFEPRRMHRSAQLDWTLVIDPQVARRMAELRESKLPNETGGVLIGSFDLKRKVAYVVDLLPSPPDSKEWPVLYIRGSEGLPAAVGAIAKRTSGQLQYIGEWHSHPRGCSCLPSNDDLLVFSWLVKHMNDAGYPALMSIVGDAGSSWYLGKISRDEQFTVV
jgi:hypothetical protein